MGQDAFSKCDSLTSIVIPDSVTSIGGLAFSNCTNLSKVTLSKSLKCIGQQAFRNCDSLTSITIPDTVTSIGHYAFSGCAGLTSMTIPSSVTTIESNTFSNCPNLTIYGKAGSYAENYAVENDIPFIAISGVLITSQPQSTTVIEGLNTVLSVSASGSNLTYQWQENDGSGWATLIGETRATLTIQNADSSKNGYKYRCIVSDGTSSVTSDEAVLTVVSSGDVTLEQVKEMTIEELIAFVNSIPPNDSTVILTEAQMYAIEKVLEYDYGRAA